MCCHSLKHPILRKVATVRLLFPVIIGAVMAQPVYGGEAKSVNVFAEDLDEQGRMCGLSESAIVSATSYPLQQSGFALLPDSQSSAADFRAYINVNLMHLPNDHCVGSVAVEFFTFGLALLPWNKEPKVEEISLCEKGGIAIYPRNSASNEFVRMIERATKDCIVKLKMSKS